MYFLIGTTPLSNIYSVTWRRLILNSITCTLIEIEIKKTIKMNCNSKPNSNC